MLSLRTLFAAGLCATFSAAALADWDPGDPHKMHFPQLPDPTGWDVNFTGGGAAGPSIFVADDWQCSQTGPVTDIHFWFSYKHDFVTPIVGIRAAIFDDIPVSPTNPYSRPGNLLWTSAFTPASPDVMIRPYGTGVQGWLDPLVGVAIPNDHTQYYQANIINIPNPFFQQFGTIYWLALSVAIEPVPGVDVGIGWKTSQDHFNDDGVTAYTDTLLWQELLDPSGVSLDLAFVITPSPGGVALAAMAGLLVLRRQR